MQLRNKQTGIGLLEVLVALVLLSIAILGYTAMQLKATNISLESDHNMHAVALARDLHERMRVNREGLNEFANGYTGLAAGGTLQSCRTTACTPANLAKFDFAAVQTNAEQLGMSLAVRACPSSAATAPTGSAQRHCIYVAWGGTTPTDGNGAHDCTNGATYRTNAQCIYMESFSYAR